MPKFEVDNFRNVVVREKNYAIHITAYDPNRAAIRIGVSYLPARVMAELVYSLFDYEKEILESMVRAGKIAKVEEKYKIDNIAFFYCSNKVLIKRSDMKIERLNKVLRAEQG
ncbi:MAG: hypothetical protein IJ809_01935 [Clostridia bacterium]|nr:hypothetical protein [Clostridia bacterium]